MSSTFDQETAKSIFGIELNGEVTKIEVEPYEYTIDSGETIEFPHSWVFTPTEAPVMQLDKAS